MLYGLTTFFLILLSSSIVFSSVVEKQRALASNVASRFSFGLAISSKDGVVLAKAISKKGQASTRVLADDQDEERDENDEDHDNGGGNKDRDVHNGDHVHVNSGSVTDKSNNSTRNGKKRRKRSSNIGPKVFDNNNLAAVVTGLPPDCRFVLDTMTSIATDHRSNFGASIQPGMLAEKIASMFHKLSLQSSSDRRLLAVEVIIASRNEIVYLDCSGM